MLNFSEISSSCAKCLLLVMNVSCILIALCTFVFAVVDTRVLKQYGEEYAAGTFIGDIVVILNCLLVLAVAALGCVGVVRNNAKMLYLYIGILMIIVVLELLVTIYVAVQRYGLEFRVSDWLREDFFKNITGDDLESHKTLWDQLQNAYECCGLNGPEDYRVMGRPVSMSCCPKAFRARNGYAQQVLFRSCLESSSYFPVGCEDEILDVLRSDAQWLFGVVIASFWFEAAGMFLAMVVANNKKYKVKVYRQTVTH